MSNYHGNLSRLSFCVQEVQDPVKFPGWVSIANTTKLKQHNANASDLIKSTDNNTPKWLSDITIEGEIISREFIHILGRYPKRNNQSYLYEMDHIVDGRTSQVSWNIVAIGLIRREYWHQKLGHGRYYIKTIFMDGSTDDTGEIYLYQNWIGTDRGPWDKYASGVVGGKPIKMVTIGFIAELESNSYHDTGDRSPGVDYKPFYPITGSLSNKGYDLFEVPYNKSNAKSQISQDVRLDRLNVYGGVADTPTVEDPIRSDPPPVPTRITTWTPPFSGTNVNVRMIRSDVYSIYWAHLIRYGAEKPIIATDRYKPYGALNNNDLGNGIILTQVAPMGDHGSMTNMTGMNGLSFVFASTNVDLRNKKVNVVIDGKSYKGIMSNRYTNPTNQYLQYWNEMPRKPWYYSLRINNIPNVSGLINRDLVIGIEFE